MGKAGGTERFEALEGLRGIAAIIVVLYHSLLGFFAVSFLGVQTNTPSVQHLNIESSLFSNPLMVFLSGTFSVSIFFVLSGFVLSIGYFQSGKESIVKSLAIRRYPRLMLPALASTLFCAILIWLGLSRVTQVYEVTGSNWLAGMWSGGSTSLLEVIRSGALGIFTEGHSYFNNPLWTMTIEFIGSFVVFITLLVAGKSRYRWLAYILLFVLTAGTWYMGFLAGMILADIYSRRSTTQRYVPAFVTVILAAAAIFFGGYPASDHVGQPYSFFSPVEIFQIPSYVIGAVALVTIALWSRTGKRILGSKYISRLGKYTFSMYLVHIPILYTLTYYIFLKLHMSYSYSISAIVALAVSVPAIAIATYLFEKYIDMPSIKLARSISTIWLEDKGLSLEPFRRSFVRARRFIRQILVGDVHPKTPQELLAGRTAAKAEVE